MSNRTLNLFVGIALAGALMFFSERYVLHRSCKEAFVHAVVMALAVLFTAFLMRPIKKS